MWIDLWYFLGRYGEEFVAKRQEKLQRWSNRIARHPVLSRSEVVNHFFLCDDTGVSTCMSPIADLVMTILLIGRVSGRLASVVLKKMNL